MISAELSLTFIRDVYFKIMQLASLSGIYIFLTNKYANKSVPALVSACNVFKFPSTKSFQDLIPIVELLLYNFASESLSPSSIIVLSNLFTIPLIVLSSAQLADLNIFNFMFATIIGYEVLGFAYLSFIWPSLGSVFLVMAAIASTTFCSFFVVCAYTPTAQLRY